MGILMLEVSRGGLTLLAVLVHVAAHRAHRGQRGEAQERNMTCYVGVGPCPILPTGRVPFESLTHNITPEHQHRTL
eukprot:4136011-Pyramimonas_sp.AAC.1